MRATTATLSGGCGGRGAGLRASGSIPAPPRMATLLARGIEAEQLRIVRRSRTRSGSGGSRGRARAGGRPAGQTPDRSVRAPRKPRPVKRIDPPCEPRPCRPRSRRPGCCAARCNGRDRPSPGGESRRDLPVLQAGRDRVQAAPLGLERDDLGPVASIASRCARTRVTTVTSSPSSRAALAMGRKWEAKNQSSVTTKTSLRPLTSGRGKEDKG